MQASDQPELEQAVPLDRDKTMPSEQAGVEEDKRFDWRAIWIVSIVSLIFAIAARLNPQPPSSLAPMAVLTASGCGLLITAIRKLRTVKGPGLREAMLGGFLLALIQFIAALSYPTLLYTISTDPDERLGFLSVWGLIALCSILFSLAGAAVGHLAFAPLRPLPNKAQKEDDAPSATKEAGNEEEIEETDTEESADKEEDSIPETGPRRSLINLIITVLLLGLAPTILGYVFSAGFDLLFSMLNFFNGPYPTLRLLSAMLPWQLPIQINVSGSNQGVFFAWLLWRIPLFLGNSTFFDVQALEPYAFNGAALGLLLLTLQREKDQEGNAESILGWTPYLVLEAILGFILVFPANLFISRGLLGLLQLDSLNLVVPIRTLYLLNPLTFSLNFITGPLICLIVAIGLRRVYNQDAEKRKEDPPAEV